MNSAQRSWTALKYQDSAEIPRQCSDIWKMLIYLDSAEIQYHDSTKMALKFLDSAEISGQQ